MKKCYYLILLFVFALIPTNCYAAPTTYERTAEDYRVPNSVEVTFDNIPIIMQIPSIDETQKVYDFTDSLTEDEEDAIRQKIVHFNNVTGLDSAIVLTNDLSGFAISDYAYNFYDYNYFNHNGIILIININEDEPGLFMGTSGSDDNKVFKIFTDDTITQILKYIYTKNIENQEYYDACNNYVKLTEAFYAEATEKKLSFTYLEKLKLLPWPELFIIAFALTFIADVLIITNFNKKGYKKKNIVKNSVNNTTMIVKKEYDNLVEMKK